MQISIYVRAWKALFSKESFNTKHLNAEESSEESSLTKRVTYKELDIVKTFSLIRESEQHVTQGPDRSICVLKL